MAWSESGAHQNRLLGALSSAERAAIDPHLELLSLPIRHDCETPDKPIQHVYFAETALVSIVARVSESDVIEVGLIGREGMTGLMVVLGGDRSPHHTYVQGAGDAYRITAANLRSVMTQQPSIRELFLTYVQSLLIQTAQTALANGRASLEARLARWLLMAHDRVDGDELAIVHDFLALMLGVRRPGVTIALHELEGHGIIKASRGRIVVVDRAGLEDAAGRFYGVAEAEYERLSNRSA